MTRKQPSGRAIEIKPLSRRLSLRSAALARATGTEETTEKEKSFWEWIDELAERARFWRTLVDVKRKVTNQPSSLERGSAATRTVVRSISSVSGSNELTHISRINRR